MKTEFNYSLPIEGTEQYILNQMEKYIQFRKTYLKIIDDKHYLYKINLFAIDDEFKIHLNGHNDEPLLILEPLDKNDLNKKFEYIFNVFKLAGKKMEDRKMLFKCLCNGEVKVLAFLGVEIIKDDDHIKYMTKYITNQMIDFIDDNTIDESLKAFDINIEESLFNYKYMTII